MNPDERNQGLCHYIFLVSLNRGSGSFGNLADPSSRICVLNKIKYVNLNVFNMITKLNEAKALRKQYFICLYM